MDGSRSSQIMPCPERLAEHLLVLLTEYWGSNTLEKSSELRAAAVMLISREGDGATLEKSSELRAAAVMLINGEGDGATLAKCSELRAATDRLCCASDKNPELMTLVLPALGEVEVVAELPKCERAFILKS
ncbi:hypothetical protein TURU_119300 [Turdus rufiventris]|nr:hypothetical protein TURU_119300 [Turdus rufiventris]